MAKGGPLLQKMTRHCRIWWWEIHMGSILAFCSLSSSFRTQRSRRTYMCLRTQLKSYVYTERRETHTGRRSTSLCFMSRKTPQEDVPDPTSPVGGPPLRTSLLLLVNSSDRESQNHPSVTDRTQRRIARHSKLYENASE
jgi:hypothetical protein